MHMLYKTSHKFFHILFTIFVFEKIGGYADEKHGGLIVLGQL